MSRGLVSSCLLQNDPRILRGWLTLFPTATGHDISTATMARSPTIIVILRVVSGLLVPRLITVYCVIESKAVRNINRP